MVLADFEYSELSEFLENNPRNVIINIVIVILKRSGANNFITGTVSRLQSDC